MRGTIQAGAHGVHANSAIGTVDRCIVWHPCLPMLESEAMQDLSGKIVLVTGAGKGIGRAAAMLFGRRGSQVVAVARTAADVEGVVAEIESNGGNGLAVAGDITDDAFVERLFGTVRDRFGRLDVLVNNAGIAPIRPVEELPPATLRACLELNLVALFNCMQRAVRFMQEVDGTGKIINVGSVRSHWTEAGSAGAYNASKQGLRAMTETVARQLHGTDSRIAVGLVCPGVVDTPLTNPKGEPRPGYLRPEEVAESIAFAAAAPPGVNIFDITLIPMAQKPW